MAVLAVRTFARPGARPGMILFVQTFGDLVNFNPHIRIEGAASDTGPVLESCRYSFDARNS
jgi:hypothetical protein